jgi:hypothetical protein
MMILSLRGDDGTVRGMIDRGEAVYCGRTQGHVQLVGSPLSNPCSIPEVACPECGAVHFGKGMVQLTACRSIGCYRKWLHRKLVTRDATVTKAMQSLTSESVLVCWCCYDEQPERCLKGEEHCHCHIIVKAWGWLQEVK